MKKKIIRILTSTVIIFTLGFQMCYASEFNWPLEDTRLQVNPIFLRNLVTDKVVSKGYHTGWDMTLGSKVSAYVYAVADGTVEKVDVSDTNGNWVQIKHTLTEDLELTDLKYYIAKGPYGPMNLYKSTDSIKLGRDIYSKYLHLASDTILVEEGQEIKAGMPIAVMGCTGRSDGAHLHFALGSQSGPSKDWDKSLLFTANGADLPNYIQGNADTFKDFSDNKYSPTCLCTIGNPKEFAISLNYIYGKYSVVDAENPINTKAIAEERLKNQIKEGYTINTPDNRFTGEYRGILAATYHYGYGNTAVGKAGTGELAPIVASQKFAKLEALLRDNYDINSNILKPAEKKDEPLKGKITITTGDETTSNGNGVNNFGDATKLDLNFYEDVIGKYAGIITSICIYIGIVAIGIGIILKRNNAEERANLISALFTIGIGALTVVLAHVIADMLTSII